MDNLSTRNIKRAAVVENISDYSADSSGKLSSANALINAINGSDSDIIHIPKGVFLIDKSFTVPENKKLVFSRNARLKLAADITIDGTWEAGEDDWIFELAGGMLKGDYKVDEIRPEWFGAKGNGITDDAKAFNNAMSVCDKKRVLLMGGKNYRVRSTISNNARGIRGTAMYVDSQQAGTMISWDPIDKTTDLLPCIYIETSGNNLVLEDFHIKGTVPYSSRTLGSYVDKELFEQGVYEMFAVGAAAVEISGKAMPVFRNVQTSAVKVGMLLNSQNGHITSYDCQWNGLIGVYCRKNSEDYFFQGGSIGGAFCGLMVGVILTSGHNGGISALTINRVHMGFSPYAIYQVIDVDIATYNSYSSVLGLNGFIEGRFEQSGESAIKLLPKSITWGLHLNGFGMSFSVTDYTNEPGRWQYSLPDDLMPPTEKQKYAAWLGILRDSRITSDRGYALKSNAPGALGTARIEVLHDGNDLKGLVPSMMTIARKMSKASTQLSDAINVSDMIREQVNNPISHGNLIEPEKITSWSVTSGATVELISDLSTLPTPFTEEMKRFLGEQVSVIKITPDGTTSPDIFIKPSTSPMDVDTSRMINYEYFIYTPSGVVASRLDYQNSKYLYNESYTNLLKNNWSHIVGREMKSPDPNFNQISIFQASATSPTYVVGLMLSYDRPAPYSPYKHNYTRRAIETTEGIILTDSSNNNRYKLTIVDGVIRAEGTELKTKIYSPSGIPYKIKVSDSGTLETELDAIYFNSFDGADNSTSIGEGWTYGNSSTWGIKDNQAYSLKNSGLSRANFQTNLINYAVTCNVKGLLKDGTNYARPGITIKYISDDNTFWLSLTNTAVTLTRRKNAVDTIVASSPFTTFDDIFYKVHAIYKDGSISVYIDKVLAMTYKFSTEDYNLFNGSTLTGLYQRIGGTFTMGARFDNFLIDYV